VVIGRPPAGKVPAQEELAELAQWLRAAAAEAGCSINALITRNALDKNQVYGMAGATRLLRLDATKSIARALGRDPNEVVPLWTRANETRKRKAMAVAGASQPLLASWAERPLPTPALMELLQAQAKAVEQLPYRLLGVEPPALSAVYVRQRVRQEPQVATTRPTAAVREADGARPDAPTVAVNEPLSITGMLNRSPHVLVDGEPGVGKSTLGYDVAHRLSRIWLNLESADGAPLDEPVLPIRLPATMLCTQGSWSAVLGEAVRLTLGMLLVNDPDPGMLSQRMHGARWLVIVDGLDEITNRQDRARVIQAIAQHAKLAGPYRFLVTTRPLPEIELTALRGGQFDTYTVQSFDREQLRKFADRWFAAQDRSTHVERSADFIRQIEDGRLIELVANPLLATIAAIAQTLEPDRPLPASRVELYQRFYDYLVNVDVGRANATFALSPTGGSATDFQRRLAQDREELVGALARTRLDGNASLLASAQDWVAARLGTALPKGSRWKDELRDVLISTGLFVHHGEDVRFLHHSFAEFLGALSMAAEIDQEFSDLDRWIERGLKPADQTLVLFLFTLWISKPAGDARVVFDRLLAGNSKHLLLAASLLAEVPEVDTEIAREVIDRMIDLALGRSSEEPLRALARIRHNDYLTERLTQLARHRDLGMSLRVEACIALGHASSPGLAVELLREVGPDTAGSAICRLAEGLLDLLPDGLDAAEAELRRLREPDRGTLKALCDAARLLAERGRISASLVMIESALELSPPNGLSLPIIARARLAISDADASAQVLNFVARYSVTSPQVRPRIAEVLAEYGDIPTAVEMATTVVISADADHAAFWRAVDVLLEFSTDDVEGTLGTIRSVKRLDVYDLSSLAKKLADAGHVEQVRKLAGPLVGDQRCYGDRLGLVVEAWLIAAGAGDVNIVLDTVQKRVSLTPWDLAEISRTLARLGYPTQAKEYAERVLADDYADLTDVRYALSTLASISEADAVQAAVQRARSDRIWTTGDLTKLVEELAKAGHEALVRQLAIEVFRDHVAGYQDTSAVATSWIELAGRRAVDEMVHECLADDSDEWLRHAIAEAAIKEGILGPARAILLTLVSSGRKVNGYGRLSAAQSLADLGDARLAVEQIEQRLNVGAFADAGADTKADLTAVLAYLRARAPD
jgi:hypothetical protein